MGSGRDSGLGETSGADETVPLERVPTGGGREQSGRRRVVWAVATGAFLVAIAVPALLLRRHHQRSTQVAAASSAPASVAATPGPRPLVAVIGFDDRSGRASDEWIGTALTELLATQLGGGGEVRIAPAEDVSRARTDLGLATVSALDARHLATLEARLASDFLVAGWYAVTPGPGGDRVAVEIEVLDATSGRTLATIDDAGGADAILDLAPRAGGRVRVALGLPGLSGEESSQVDAALPTNPESMRLYAEAQGDALHGDYVAAHELLLRCVTIDPGNPTPHRALAIAWLQLGYDRKARDEADRAFQLAGSLSREDRLLAEGLDACDSDRWERAIEVYSSLWELHPTEPDFGIALADVQTQGGRPQDALETVARLRALAPPDCDSAAIDMQEVAARGHLGDLAGELHAGQVAETKAEASADRFTEAKALLEIGIAQAQLGRTPDGLDALGKAQAIYQSMGDRNGVAEALEYSAETLDETGAIEAGRKAEESALAVYREIGDQNGEGNALYLLGGILSEEGDVKGARDDFTASLDLFKDTDDRNLQANAMLGLGNLSLQAGDNAGATRWFQAGLADYQSMGDQDSTAVAQTSLGSALFFEGQLKDASADFEAALALERKVGSVENQAINLMMLGSVIEAEGDLPNAEKDYGEAARLRDGAGERGAASESRLALADVEVEEGRYEDAEKLVRVALAEIVAEKLVTDESSTYDQLAQTLLGQGRVVEARAAIAEAIALPTAGQIPEVELESEITAARVDAAAGAVASAEARLGALRDQADKAGAPNASFLARLQLGRVEMAAGDAVDGRAILSTLATDSAARGFGLIAHDAATLAATPAGSRVGP